MNKRTAYITIDSVAKCERPIFSNFLGSMELLGDYGFKDAVVFHRHYNSNRNGLETDYIIDTETSLRIQGRSSPIQELPNHSQIYSGGFFLGKFDADKITAILETAPVAIIVPSKRYARQLERTVINLGYQYERV